MALTYINCESFMRVKERQSQRDFPSFLMILYSVLLLFTPPQLSDCALLYLPYIAGSGLVHARVFQNQLLTHIPIMYHVFLQPWMENLPFSIK